jgi:hypothetical protein
MPGRSSLLGADYVNLSAPPGIHVLAAFKKERRGWPGRSPAMTESDVSHTLLAREHVAEQHVALAIETHQPHLFDRAQIRRGGFQTDARQQQRQLHVEVRGLLHDVFARKMAAALALAVDQDDADVEPGKRGNQRDTLAQ